jgi:chemotaxis protein methyltransferase CheR
VFAEAGLDARVRLCATDISRTALTKARAATYTPWSLRGEGAARVERYLRPFESGFRVVDEIRERVHFDHLNLALDVYPSLASHVWGMDLILCRNVLIYLDRAAVENVAHRLFASLADGGWLITGRSDPPLAHVAPFEQVSTEAGMLYRRGAPPAFVTPPPPVARAAPPPVLALRPRPPVGPAAEDPIVEARRAFAAGQYARAVALTQPYTDDPLASVVHARALANLDLAEAERACAAASARHPLSTEVHYLWALLLLELGRDDEAARAIRRVIYLDRSLAVAHLALGAILHRQGDAVGARRAYRNARALCAARPADEVAPLSDGERCARLAEAADVQLGLLEASAGVG